jgi:predicted homoserine dehydrogenase-like protein
MNSTSRRGFLKRSAAVSAGIAGGTSLGTAPWLRAAGANDAIRLGVVGVGSHVKGGGMGRGEIRHFQRIPGVRVVALCDVDSAILGAEADRLRKATRRWPRMPTHANCSKAKTSTRSL